MEKLLQNLPAHDIVGLSYKTSKLLEGEIERQDGGCLCFLDAPLRAFINMAADLSDTNQWWILVFLRQSIFKL